VFSSRPSSRNPVTAPVTTGPRNDNRKSGLTITTLIRRMAATACSASTRSRPGTTEFE
jgi:hypothetical protein